MLTQTEVDPEDPAFKNPTKFIGPCYPEEEAERCACSLQRTSSCTSYASNPGRSQCLRSTLPPLLAVGCMASVGAK